MNTPTWNSLMVNRTQCDPRAHLGQGQCYEDQGRRAAAVQGESEKLVALKCIFLGYIERPVVSVDGLEISTLLILPKLL